jgi:CcmD family protein
MTHSPLAAILNGLLAVIQETAPAAGFTAETVAAQPAVAARGFRFLIGAYSAVWTILVVYLVTLSVRLRRLSSQVRRLKERAGL